MTRKKVTLAYITNDSERKASFKKRKKGLVKKVRELSTLCGVEACAIIYSQYDQQPEVWPSIEGAQAVLNRFRRLSEMDQTRKMVNQESFTRQRIKKTEDQLRRVHNENKRWGLENFMYQCIAGMVSMEDFDLRDAGDMKSVINQSLRDIASKVEMLKNGRDQNRQAVSAAEVAVAPPPVEVVAPPPSTTTPVNVVAPPPPTNDDDFMESLPWNLVLSPSNAIGSGLVYSRLGWEDEMALPYPYMFNNGNYPGNGTGPN